MFSRPSHRLFVVYLQMQVSRWDERQNMLAIAMAMRYPGRQHYKRQYSKREINARMSLPRSCLMSMMSVHIFATELHRRIEVFYLITTVSCHASCHSIDYLGTKRVFIQNGTVMSLLKVPILSSCP